jgi:HK97 family phage major capsid protein
MSTEMKKAKEIIDGLIRNQQNSTDKLQNIEKQLSDLKTAQRLIEESQQAPAVVDYAPESELKSFVKDNGSIQWTTEAKHVESSSGRRVTVEEAGLLDTEANCSDWHKELKEIARDRHLARLIMPDPYTPKLDARLYRHLNKAPRAILPAIQKAFNDQAGTGAEFIPDQFISDLYQEFQVPKRLRGLLNRVEAERNTLLIPRLNRGGRPYIKGEITVDSPLSQYTTSTASTGQKTINIKGLACSYVIDDAFAEDSAIAALPILSQQIVQDIEDALEDCMINGDTAATHQDTIASWNIRNRWGASGLGGSADHRRAFVGMRAAANDQANLDVSGTASGVTASEILGGLSSLGELGAGNIVMVCSPEFMLKHLMGLTEVQTLDVFGPQASIVNGQIASVFGVPVVMSRFMSADLASTGLYTGSGSQTGYLLFNTSSWYLYERRGIVLEQQKDISAGAIRLVATYRAVMGSPDQAGIKNVYNGSDYNS